MTAQVYIIMHEQKSTAGVIKLRAIGKVYENWADADARAKQTALDFKCKCWVCGIDSPYHGEIIDGEARRVN